MNGIGFAHSLYLGGGAGTPAVERPAHRGAASAGVREQAVLADPILLSRPYAAGLRALLRAAGDLERRVRE